jgi:hypothetical protein
MMTGGRIETKLAFMLPGLLALKVVELAVEFTTVTPPVVVQLEKTKLVDGEAEIVMFWFDLYQPPVAGLVEPPVGAWTVTRYSAKYVPVTAPEPVGVMTDPDCRVASPEVEAQT